MGESAPEALRRAGARCGLAIASAGKGDQQSP
jgi:hypothetical protein